MVINIGLLLLLGANNFVILYISNIGYVFCHVLALTGFLLLRRDRPDWPRPIKAVARHCGLAVAGLTISCWRPDRKVASYIGFYEFKGLPLFLGSVLVLDLPSAVVYAADAPGGRGRSAPGRCFEDVRHDPDRRRTSSGGSSLSFSVAGLSASSGCLGPGPA